MVDEAMELTSKILLIFGIIFSFSICGCVSMSLPRKTESTMTSLEATAMPKFADVPTPASFKFLSNDSFAFQNDLFRVALLKYQGKGTGEQVVEFYKEQMPLYKWNLINVVEYGIKTLNFERVDETCTIIIDSKGSKSKISISVASKAGQARAVSEKSKK